MSDVPKETPPPVELSGPNGVSIHLSYIRRDLDEMKKLQNENWSSLHKELTELKGAYISREEFAGWFREISEIKKHQEDKLVTKEEFEPTKKITYGLVTLVVTAVVVAVLALVIK